MHEAAHPNPLPAAGFDPEALRAGFPLLAVRDYPARRRRVTLAWGALNAILAERSVSSRQGLDRVRPCPS
jgi:hypothetical protein